MSSAGNCSNPAKRPIDQVCEHFGPSIYVNSDGQYRSCPTAANRVYGNRNAKRWLETMLHPLIHQRSGEAIRRPIPGPVMCWSWCRYCSKPIFSPWSIAYWRSIVPAEVQIERLMKRDRHRPQELANSMVAQQLDNPARASSARTTVSTTAVTARASMRGSPTCTVATCNSRRVE